MSAVREAIVVAGAGDAERRVGGVPLLVRTLLVLQRAGIERCTVVGGEVPADRRLRLACASAREMPAPSDDALRLVVGPGAVIDGALVADLLARARPGEVLAVEEDGARVRIAPGRLVAANGAPARPAAGTLRRADAPGVERVLLRGLENHHDGYVDVALYRRLSRPLTRLLLGTPLSPNAVTVIGIVLGVAGGLLLGAASLGGVAAGVLLLVVSGVLDCSDGELARLRLAESPLGHWLDMTGDLVVNVAVLAGVGLHLASTGRMPGWGTFVLLGAGVLGAFGVISWSEQTEERRHRVPGWENRLLDGVLGPLTTRDWHVFVVGFALAGRTDAMVRGAAVGAHVFWAVTLIVLLRVLRRC